MTAASPPAVPEWTLADRLRKARHDVAGYSQAELSRRTGISQRSIVRYERGQSEPGRPELLAWATACHVKYEWLTGAAGPDDELMAVKDLPPKMKRYLADHVRAAAVAKRTA